MPQPGEHPHGRSKHASLRAAAARERGDVDALIAMLESTDPTSRRSAVANLADPRFGSAVDPLTRMLQAKDEHVRIGALKALAEIGDKSVTSAVHELAVSDPSFGVRMTAMSTLGSLGDRRAVTLIGSAIGQPDVTWPRWYRSWAAKRLTELGGTEAFADLEAARRGAGPIGRWRLRRAIRALKAL
jgi:HEAT repeat protein